MNIFEKIEKARLELGMVDMVADAIGNFLGLSDNEEAAKYGLRLMTIKDRNELMEACDRVRGWVVDVNQEVFAKEAKR